MSDIQAVNSADASAVQDTTSLEDASKRFSVAAEKAKAGDSNNDSTDFDSKFDNLIIKAGTSFGSMVLLPEIQNSMKSD